MRSRRRVGVAHTLRKDQERLARPEVVARGRKHRLVPRGVGAPLLAAVDGQRAHQTQEGADERVAEIGAVATGTNRRGSSPSRRIGSTSAFWWLAATIRGPDSGIVSRPTRSMRRWTRT